MAEKDVLIVPPLPYDVVVQACALSAPRYRHCIVAEHPLLIRNQHTDVLVTPQTLSLVGDT
jgi:hypothetical protein